MEIHAHPGLALGDLPGTDGLAFGSPETKILIDDDRPVFVLVVRGKGTDGGTGRVVAMHAPSGDIEGLPPSIHVDVGLVDIQVVVRRETIDNLSLPDQSSMALGRGQGSGMGSLMGGILSRLMALHAATQAGTSFPTHPSQRLRSMRVASPPLPAAPAGGAAAPPAMETAAAPAVHFSRERRSIFGMLDDMAGNLQCFWKRDTTRIQE
jgi:hypothetical protein